MLVHHYADFWVVICLFEESRLWVTANIDSDPWWPPLVSRVLLSPSDEWDRNAAVKLPTLYRRWTGVCRAFWLGGFIIIQSNGLLVSLSLSLTHTHTHTLHLIVRLPSWRVWNPSSLVVLTKVSSVSEETPWRCGYRTGLRHRNKRVQTPATLLLTFRLILLEKVWTPLIHPLPAVG